MQDKDGNWVSSKSRAKASKSPYPPTTVPAVEGTFDWKDVDGKLLAGAVGGITTRGDAVSYALNRSRTQGSITILSGSERPRYTFSTVEQAEEWLRAIVDAL